MIRIKHRLIVFIMAILLLNLNANGQLEIIDKPKTASIIHETSECIPNVLILKTKEEYRDIDFNNLDKNDELQLFFDRIGLKKIDKKFPKHNKPIDKRDALGREYVDLSLIYEMTFESELPIEKIIASLKNSGRFAYVEPKYIPDLLYLPNDIYADTSNTANFRLYYLLNIMALQGWDIAKGDSTSVIGIVDTGTDPDHPDLMANIAYNANDTIDGIDNDNDGFTDNYMGWDLGEFDNDPSTNTVVHGSHVSGISSASTDNLIGVAGVGFKCRFLPVKVDNEDGLLTMSYEGIVYAADHGCNVINCSWGSTFGNGNFGQDIINYASINKNALVIAASGNDNNESLFYPASYDNVISVAATNSNDYKWITSTTSGSNYNYKIDVSAPGEQIFSTLSNNTYTYSSGTSTAAAVVSGVAAILHSQFPDLSATQIGEKLRINTDIIDTIQNNLLYLGKLGKGRLNLFKALTDSNSASIRMTKMLQDEEYFLYLTPGTTANIICQFTNFLDTITGLSIKISSENPYIEILDSVFSPNIILPENTINNESDPFVFYLNDDIPSNAEVVFKFSYTGNGYEDFEYTYVLLNGDFINLDTNNITASITSEGRFVYHNEYDKIDLGFLHKEEENLLFCGGLMLGCASNKVSDNVYGNNGSYDRDFASIMPLHANVNNTNSDMELISSFNDSLASYASLNLSVTQHTHAWNNNDSKDFIIIEYDITNTDDENINTLYAGIYCDWDLNQSTLNKAFYNEALRLGYTYDAFENRIYAGVKLLSTSGNDYCYCIDNDGAGGIIDLFDNDYFSTYEKFYGLTHNRWEGGVFNQGNDVSQIIGQGPLAIIPKDTVRIAFAMVVGNNLSELESNAITAQNYYNDFIYISQNDFPKTSTILAYPNPADEYLYLKNIASNPKAVEIISGKGVIYSITNFSLNSQGELKISLKEIPEGIYFLKLKFEAKEELLKFIKQKNGE